MEIQSWRNISSVSWDDELGFLINIPEGPIRESARHQIYRIPGGKWSAKSDRGQIPGSTVTIGYVLDLIRTYSLMMDESAQRVVFDLNQQAEENNLLSIRRNGMDIKFNVTGDLHPYQKVGAYMALRNERVLICDEPGLGKTMQGIAVLSEIDEPAIIICPKSVKRNWMREILKWLYDVTDADIHILRGSRPHKLPDVRFHILNHDILPYWILPLMELNRRVFIIDEIHKVSNSKSLRGKATYLLTNYSLKDYMPVKREDPVTLIGLSGTPVANHPREIIHPLRMMGVLDHFGGAGFIERTCCIKPQTIAAQVALEASLTRFNKALRDSGVYRRMIKAEVIPDLPPKGRYPVPIELDNWSQYQRAEEDFKAWAARMNAYNEGGMDAWLELVRQHRLLDMEVEDPEVMAKYKKDFPILTQGMAMVNTLCQISFLGKLSSIQEWVDDFLASGEKLVVFAWFKKSQEALLNMFPKDSTVAIFQRHNERQREEAVDRFQEDPRINLMVASILAAGEGITLTAASNVAFTETGWVPGQMEQAEDRVHRITQTYPVGCHYLVGAGTIEEHKFRVIDKKLKIISRLVNGKDITEMPVINPVISELLEAA